MTRIKKSGLFFGLIFVSCFCISLVMAGCAGMSFDASTATSIVKSGKAVAKSFQDITPEQEYYIGRTVGATILNTYKPYNNAKVNNYINLLGQTLARASEKPETFGGYHFLVLDSDEINAFAAPGGLIFITRGLLKCCKTEDAVAAVLAHEIGHVQEQHGLQSIKKSRITSAITTIGAEGAKQLGGAEIASLTQVFEDSINDITQTMVTNGYSRKFEKQADQAAVYILKNVGYNPNSLIEMLEVMQQNLKPEGTDFAKTHPSPEKRIAEIKGDVGEYTKTAKHKARDSRFKTALGNI